MRKAMASIEKVRTADEVDQEDRQRQRMSVIREFIESKSTRATARVDKN